MEHHLDLSHGATHGSRVTDVRLDELATQTIEVLPVTGAQIVENDHFVAIREQLARQIGADETGAAGDQGLQGIAENVNTSDREGPAGNGRKCRKLATD
jgi:hypothetical protein